MATNLDSVDSEVVFKKGEEKEVKIESEQEIEDADACKLGPKPNPRGI